MKNILVKNRKKLDKTRLKSFQAVDCITKMITKLTKINDEINSVLDEIAVEKDAIRETEQGLNETKTNNEEMIAKFQKLLKD